MCNVTGDYKFPITGDPVESGFVMDDALYELVKAIRNRCDAIVRLYELGDTDHIMPTLLEDLHEDSQELIDDYCVCND